MGSAKIQLIAAAGGVAAGGAVHLIGADGAADALWATTTATTLTAMVERLTAEPSPDEMTALRRVLYSLYAVLRLHRAGEEERLASVVDDPHTLPPDGRLIGSVPESKTR